MMPANEEETKDVIQRLTLVESLVSEQGDKIMGLTETFDEHLRRSDEAIIKSNEALGKWEKYNECYQIAYHPPEAEID